MVEKIKLAVLLSGGGRTLQNFIDKIAAGELDAQIVAVISSRADAYGLERAKKHSLPHFVVPARDYIIRRENLPADILEIDTRRRDEGRHAHPVCWEDRLIFPLVSGNFFDFKPFSEKLVEVLDQHCPDLIAMAGFMCYWEIPEKYAGKVMNIHPALIPAFCGDGLYGHYVHEAVIEYGAKFSGCTVHFADNQYDHGPIILQRVVEVKDDDTPDSLADRVFKEECIAYPEAIQLFAEGRLKIKSRRVHNLPG